LGSRSDFAAHLLNFGSLTPNGSAPIEPQKIHGFSDIGKWPVSFNLPQQHCRMGFRPLGAHMYVPAAVRK
jgi:hypothetical protein